MSGSEIRQKDRAFYKEIANRIGTIMRDQIIRNSRKKSIKSLQTFTITDLSPKMSRYDKNKSSSNNNSIVWSNPGKSKKKDVQKFKQKLKRNLQQSRVKKQLKTQQLSNKIRWRRNLMMKNRRQKMDTIYWKNREETNLMKSMIEMKKNELSRKKRQLELEKTFNCLERRLKSLQKS